MQISNLSGVVLLAVAAFHAQASVIFSIGNNPQADEPVLFHDSCAGCVDGPALLVIGHLQTSDYLVDLTSDSFLSAVGPGHNTVSSDSGFDQLGITVPGHSYTSIVLQLTSLSTVPDGTVTFTAHTLADGDFNSSALFDDHTGGNYFTITTDMGSRMTGLDLTTTQLQHDVSQVRIGEAGLVTPEPGSLILLGSALIAAGFICAKRRTLPGR